MTKREVMAKYGISMICQDLDEKADEKFEKIVKKILRTFQKLSIRTLKNFAANAITVGTIEDATAF